MTLYLQQMTPAFVLPFRVFVCRNERDEGEVTGALARIGRWGKPTNISIDATWATFEEGK
jgi:hypothetical protein